ncbi:MAG: DUF721 domain-containing protein [Bacteroidetes bacterium HGW-Bacteroidetes-2]|jgi:hypothetical protein|nr:MAG: DUF721 domain-containing protein [Bacteroidetes bacterium HGW-Bacteroidetes-2]
MAKRHGENITLGDVLKDFVKSNKLNKGLDKVQVIDVWNTMMGPAIEKYTTNIKLERETLYVELSSSVLREELSYGKQKIIDLLNEELGRLLIKELVLR